MNSSRVSEGSNDSILLDVDAFLDKDSIVKIIKIKEGERRDLFYFI